MKKIKAEDRWADTPCGHPAVLLEEGMRLKDLPEYFRVAAVPSEGGYEPIRFRAGKFIAVSWVAAADDFGWKTAVETIIPWGSYLMADEAGNVTHMEAPNESI